MDPSWVDLGLSWVPSWADSDVKIVLSPSVALVFLKIDFLKKMRVQEATWVDFGSIWVAQGGQDEGRGGSKSEMS